MTIIAGPCSIESRQQLAEAVATLTADSRVAMVRGGVWKPRTRPGGFEGIGLPALQWVAELKAERPFAFCCEVALPEHVEMCLRHGVDAVWIGARTTANPFAMSELAQALRGTALPVMVKNAPSPDVRLWAGAIERCQAATTGVVSAILRGFDIYNNLGYRNAPLWDVALELRRLMPSLPLLCDPSHITGRRDAIAATAQTALDLGLDGLMVEVHPHPADALTDADQQLTPHQFIAVLDGLVERRSDSQKADSALADCRAQIDAIDQQLLQLLQRRMDIARDIATVKRQLDLPLYQPQRWQTLLDHHRAAAQAIGLDPDFATRLFNLIHSESLRTQQEL